MTFRKRKPDPARTRELLSFRMAVPPDTFTPRELEILDGLIDRAHARNADPQRVAPDNGPQFWSLREMIRDSELPDCEVGTSDRLYLRLGPFDTRIKRESEGVVIDVFGLHDTGVVASTSAFLSDVEPHDSAEHLAAA